MSPRVQHLIETRFSVRLRLSEASFAPAWLERRVELWRRFCLPSVASQSAADFTWLVLCDESTDPEAIASLRSAAGRAPALEVALTAADRTPADVVRSLVRPDTDVLITTWLDSDDALAERYVERVRSYATPFAESGLDTLLINFPRGFRLDVAAGRLYEDWMINSPFASLLERPGRGPVGTVLGSGHVMLPHEHPTHHDESQHGWLIAVHGGNLINRIGPRSRSAAFDGHAPPGFSLDPTPPRA